MRAAAHGTEPPDAPRESTHPLVGNQTCSTCISTSALVLPMLLDASLSRSRSRRARWKFSSKHQLGGELTPLRWRWPSDGGHGDGPMIPHEERYPHRPTGDDGNGWGDSRRPRRDRNRPRWHPDPHRLDRLTCSQPSGTEPPKQNPRRSSRRGCGSVLVCRLRHSRCWMASRRARPTPSGRPDGRSRPERHRAIIRARQTSDGSLFQCNRESAQIRVRQQSHLSAAQFQHGALLVGQHDGASATADRSAAPAAA